MTDPRLPLFAAAGVEVAERPRPPKKPRSTPQPPPPSPAERAAAARARGARRPRLDGEARQRIGKPHSQPAPQVVGFPFSRNASLVADAVARLPKFWDDDFEAKWRNVGRNIERRLIRHGIPKDAAYASARDLLDAALDVRAGEGYKERGYK